LRVHGETQLGEIAIRNSQLMLLVRFSELGKLDGTHENVIGGQGMFAKVWQGMSGPDWTALNGRERE